MGGTVRRRHRTMFVRCFLDLQAGQYYICVGEKQPDREITEDAGKLRLQTVSARSDYVYSFCESDGILACCIFMYVYNQFEYSTNYRRSWILLSRHGYKREKIGMYALRPKTYKYLLQGCCMRSFYQMGGVG